MPKLSARANQMLIGVPSLKHEPGTDLVFQTTRFPEFWQSEIPANEGKKNKSQNSRLVQTKCSLVCQSYNTSQGQTSFSQKLCN